LLTQGLSPLQIDRRAATADRIGNVKIDAEATDVRVITFGSGLVRSFHPDRSTAQKYSRCAQDLPVGTA
jgi:hypothetical protein